MNFWHNKSLLHPIARKNAVETTGQFDCNDGHINDRVPLRPWIANEPLHLSWGCSQTSSTIVIMIKNAQVWLQRWSHNLSSLVARWSHMIFLIAKTIANWKFNCSESCSDEQVLRQWWSHKRADSIDMMIAKEQVVRWWWSSEPVIQPQLWLQMIWSIAMMIPNEQDQPRWWSHKRLIPVMTMIANMQTVWLQQSLHERNNQQVRNDTLEPDTSSCLQPFSQGLWAQLRVVSTIVRESFSLRVKCIYAPSSPYL